MSQFLDLEWKLNIFLHFYSTHLLAETLNLILTVQ